MMKIEGSVSASESGSISQRHGSADPDPEPLQNVMDPENCQIPSNCGEMDKSLHIIFLKRTDVACL
jgi:hypothetical protein